MCFIERTKNCHFVNCYRVLKNIRFGLFSGLSLLCERVSPKNWKIYKHSLKMNNYYPYLYINIWHVRWMSGRGQNDPLLFAKHPKIGHYANFFHMLNGSQSRKPLRCKGYRRSLYKYIIPDFVYDCPLKYREFLKIFLGT